MKINADSVINLILKDHFTNYSDISKLVIDYAKLFDRMTNINKQDWCFRMGKESNLNKLKEIKDNFNRTREDFNNSTIDDLIEKTKELELNILKYNDNNGMPKFLKTIAINKYSSDLCYVNELIELKSKVKEIYSINFYIENPEELALIL